MTGQKKDDEFSIINNIAVIREQQGMMLERFDEIAETLESLGRLYRQVESWSGNYRSIEVSIEERVGNREVDLGIRGRALLVRTDQTITVRLNEKTKDEITVTPFENLILTGWLKPRMTVNRLFISTPISFDHGKPVANVKILAFG